jgi:hypothetical protein
MLSTHIQRGAEMECMTAAAERPGRMKSARTKVGGGFRFVSTTQIAAAWAALSDGQIRFRAFRVWWACHELVARREAHERSERRKGTRPEGKRNFTVEELHRLVGGVGGQHLRADLRGLEHAGLLKWSETAITFLEGPDELRDCGAALAMSAQLGGRARRVPVPRQTIRFIAGGARRVVVAAMLGHLIRCVFYKGKGECTAEGSCSASWVSRAFGVHRSNVVEARGHLEQIGWLRTVEADGWHVQRYGGRAVVSLSWSRPAPHDASSNQSESRPPAAVSTTELRPPLILNQELLTEYQNQKPASGGPVGAFSKAEFSKKPSMAKVVPADLANTERSLALFEDAMERGYVGAGEGERLKFIAAVEHARTIGDRNPCGLLAWVVRGRRWDYITQSDEDAAHRRIKNSLGHARPPEEKPKRPAISFAERVPLSDDARLAQAVQAVARQHRFADAFLLLRRERPDWTRERWGRAVAEIENARLARLQTLHAEHGCGLSWKKGAAILE